MNVIYIQKSWLETIGEVKDKILIRSEDANYISVLASEKKLTVGFPFVEVDLIRSLADEEAEMSHFMLPAKIPSSLISGIFDFTRKETEAKFGFVPPKKKRS